MNLQLMFSPKKINFQLMLNTNFFQSSGRSGRRRRRRCWRRWSRQNENSNPESFEKSQEQAAKERFQVYIQFRSSELESLFIMKFFGKGYLSRCFVRLEIFINRTIKLSNFQFMVSFILTISNWRIAIES